MEVVRLLHVHYCLLYIRKDEAGSRQFLIRNHQFCHKRKSQLSRELGQREGARRLPYNCRLFFLD